jgi:hypothetical protein
MDSNSVIKVEGKKGKKGKKIKKTRREKVVEEQTYRAVFDWGRLGLLRLSQIKIYFKLLIDSYNICLILLLSI